ncbi:MAG: hypothetical protein ABH851_07380, partial [Methanobacteriota archaeon]
MAKKNEEGYVTDPYKLEKRLALAEARVSNNSKICTQNRNIILDYKRQIELKENLSMPRIEKWLNTLSVLAVKLNKPFDKAKKEDIEYLVEKIKKSHYSDNTKVDFLRMLKKFY